MTNPKDEAASEFEKAYEEFRHKHINASFMPKEMAKFMFLAGRASKEIRLPDIWIARKKLDELKEEWIKLQVPEEVIQTHAALFSAGWNLCVENISPIGDEIKALNECEGEK